jgi:hypothetical protein
MLPLGLLMEGSKWANNNNNENANDAGVMDMRVVKPRSLAARSAATRMLSILNQSPGQTLGYDM